MQLRTCYTSPCVTVVHDEAHHILYLDWQGSLALADVHQLCPTLRQQLQDLACKKLIINNMYVYEADSGLRTWLQAELLPTLTRLGVECAAWISGLALQNHSGFRLLVSAFSPVRLEAFSDVEQAATWLQRA